MKNLNLLFRRTHLYLGMMLIPWMFIYAVSTLMINHGPFFRQFRPGPDGFIQLWEKQEAIELPETQLQLREWAAGVLAEHGWGGGPFGVRRQPQLHRVVINAPRFLKPVRLIYHLDEQTLTAERREPSWVETFLRLHFRAGYGPPGSRQMIWGFIVDLVCFSFLIWIVTGLYLWWKIPHTRGWGWLALGAGLASFVGMLFAL